MVRVTIADSTEQMLDQYGCVIEFEYNDYTCAESFIREFLRQGKVVMIEGEE